MMEYTGSGVSRILWSCLTLLVSSGTLVENFDYVVAP